MGKLYLDVNKTEEFLVTYQGASVPAYAYSSDIYPSQDASTYIKVVDSDGHIVKAVIPGSDDSTPRQLVIRVNEGEAGDLCYVEADGVISSTSISVYEIPNNVTLTVEVSSDITHSAANMTLSEVSDPTNTATSTSDTVSLTVPSNKFVDVKVVLDIPAPEYGEGNIQKAAYTGAVQMGENDRTILINELRDAQDAYPDPPAQDYYVDYNGLTEGSPIYVDSSGTPLTTTANGETYEVSAYQDTFGIIEDGNSGACIPLQITIPNCPEYSDLELHRMMFFDSAGYAGISTNISEVEPKYANFIGFGIDENSLVSMVEYSYKFIEMSEQDPDVNDPEE